MKIHESVTIESDPFDPEQMVDTVAEVWGIVKQTEVVGFEVVKSSIKCDEPKWKFAVLMRRKPCTEGEWQLTLEAIAAEAPF